MRIFVGNLPFKTDEHELKNMFSDFGRVSEARVITDRENGQSKGFGFVDMPDATEAVRAIGHMNGTLVPDQHGKRRALTVNEARPKPNGGRREN
jgi:RNA recognition motif-containing protein